MSKTCHSERVILSHFKFFFDWNMNLTYTTKLYIIWVRPQGSNKDGITTATASGLQTVIQNKKSKSNIKEDLIAYGGGYLTEYNSSLNQLPKDEEEEEQEDEVETHTLEKKTQRGPDESDVLKRILDYISSEIRVTEG